MIANSQKQHAQDFADALVTVIPIKTDGSKNPEGRRRIGGIETAQQFLGHTQTRTTEINYAEINEELA